MCSQCIDPVEFIIPCYKVDTYKHVYDNAIFGINGQELWGESIYIPPLPPNFGKKKGRPARARRRDIGEPPLKRKKDKGGVGPSTLRKKKTQYALRFNHYKTLGHNTKTCPDLKKTSEAQEDETDVAILESIDLNQIIQTQASQTENKGKQKVTRTRARR